MANYLLLMSAGMLCCLLLGVMSDGKTDPPCGGTITALSGKLNSPNYPYDVSANKTCTWQFAINHTEKQPWIYLYFTDFMLSADDVLNITMDNSSQTYDGIQGPFLLILRPNSVVSYSTGVDPASPRRFLARYNAKECRYFVQGNDKLLQSPINVPKEKGGYVNCTWTMTPDYAPSAVVLSFLTFNMSNDSWVTVFDGPNTQGTVLGNYTESANLPADLFSDMHMTVSLHLDTSAVNDTFSAQFTETTKTCTQKLDVDEELVLRSPQPLHETVKCVWILQSKPNTTFAVQVDELKFASVSDSLLISDGPSRYSPPLQVLAYNANKPVNSYIISKSNQLFISFYSEQTIPESSFSLLLNVQSAGGHYYNEGTFSLLPNKTHGNASVIFYLTVPDSKQVEVTVKDSTKLMPFSQILFYDSLNNELVAKFNSTTPFYPVFASGHEMRVEAKNFLGISTFSATFSSIPKGCNVFSRNRVGAYQLTNALSGPCAWLVQPNTNLSGVISLTVDPSHLPVNGAVHIYRGLAPVSTKLLQALTQTSKFQVTIFIPASEGLRAESIGDHSAANHSGSWLSAFYEIMPECNYTINLTGHQLVNVSNPGYPSLYPFNAKCSWHFYVPPKKLIHLTFSDIQLYPNHDMQVHSLKNGTRTQLLSVNGSAKVDDMLILDDDIIIEWNSVHGNLNLLQGRGFSMQLEVLDCGGNITASSGFGETPGYPNSVNKSVVCVWIFDVPEKASTSDLNNIEFHFEESNKSNASHLEFYDGGSLSAPVLENVFANTANFSRTHKLLVRYTHTDPHLEGTAYKIVMKSHACDPDNQCKNGICMHADWKCSGINDCGDYSDELNCSSSTGGSGGIAPAWLALAVLLGILAGVALALLGPFAVNKLRVARQRYHDFRTLPDA